jgi:hypothetical protein
MPTWPDVTRRTEPLARRAAPSRRRATNAATNAATTAGTVAALLLAAVAGACSQSQEPEAATGCAATVREASLAAEVDEQIVLLDLALARCISVGALVGEMARYPGIVGYSPATFVELRCGTATEETVRTSAVCTSYAAPATTVLPVSPDVVYVAETLDGRRIEIVPDADTPFVDGRPEPMQRTVDIAVESGCQGVIAERDRWVGLIGDPALGDEASAYARHAENVASYIRCVFEPLSASPPVTG